MSDWCSPDEARTLWADAPEDDALLDHLLNIAQEGCEAYAPALPAPVPPDPVVVPPGYTGAVAMLAQDTWNAYQRDTGDVIGFGDTGWPVRAKPLSASVKALLRPRQAVPRVG